MHLSTKSTWHHHTVPFQSLKSCKISRGSCQHNATSAFTAVGSTYHYLHCKHFDITLTQPALLEIQDTSPTLYLLKERTKWVFDQILNRTVLTTKLWNKYSGYFFFFCLRWRPPSEKAEPVHYPIQDSHTELPREPKINTYDSRRAQLWKWVNYFSHMILILRTPACGGKNNY